MIPKENQTNKISVGQKSELYNNSFKKWLKNTDMEMHSVVAERFIRTLKTKIYKWLQYQKNVYIDKMNNIVNEYDNTYHRKIKMKASYRC